MVDEKRHIRFADWSATDVSCLLIQLIIINIIINIILHFPDRGSEQVFIPHFEAGYLFDQPVRKGLRA